MKTAPLISRVALAWLVVCACGHSEAAKLSESPRNVPATGEIVFSRDILPILSDNCFHCHGPDPKAREADLRLDQKDSALRTENPVIVPGKSAASELMRRVLSQDDDEQMPPPKSNRKLTARQIELLARWIDQGAAWGQHWAYEAPRRPALPAVKNKAWPKNEIDAFVLARLERDGLRPGPEAAKEILIRRVSLDLTGLPPTPAEVDAFLADSSPAAYEKVVDRLLASPHYGQRMAWDWLDAARYADSNGYQGDLDRTMWPWRDWVVRALNANMPYDQFTIEQLAGDLLPAATRDQKIATGFCRNHMINGEGGRIPEESRIDYVMDQTETLATIWLGVTFTCCRCHDHKYDPFTQKDYYRLFAFFNQTPVTGSGRSGQTAPLVDMASAEQIAKRKELGSEVQRLTDGVRAKEKELRDAEAIEKDGQYASKLPALIESTLRKGPGDRTPVNRQAVIDHYKASQPGYIKLLEQLEKARGKLNDFTRKLPQVMVMEDMATPRDTFMLARGAYDKPGEKVTAGVPANLPALASETQANRLALAKWLMDPNHPLTARVTMNRYWQMFFGIGLVKTVEDFGVQGERPSHPELLDWLATEFIRRNWDVKAMHKLLVISAAYRQTSQAAAALIERDPENRLLARGARYRLPSWMIRDQALAIGGLLVDKLDGQPVKPYQPEGIWEEATFGRISYQQDHGEALYRRSLYAFWRRIVGPTMFFDTAARQVCTVKAVRTNTPLHALTTLNDVTYVEAARSMAQRVLHEGGKTADERIAAAYRLATLRQPTSVQRQTLARSLEKLQQSFAINPKEAAALLAVGESSRDTKLDPVEHAAYTALCTLILNLDEVLSRQ